MVLSLCNIIRKFLLNTYLRYCPAFYFNYLGRINKNVYPQEDMFKDVHSSFVCKTQTVEITLVSINKKVIKSICYIYKIECSE